MYTHVLSDEEGDLQYVRKSSLMRKGHLVFTGKLNPIEDDGANYHDQS